MEETEMRSFNAFAALIFILVGVLGSIVACSAYHSPADAAGPRRCNVDAGTG